MSIILLPADLDDPRVQDLLTRHAERARRETGRGSAHALDADAFKTLDIEVWTAWDGDRLLAAGAWQRLSPEHGELKAFYTEEVARGRGVASLILDRLVDLAKAAGVTRMSLETGSWPYFAPARAFYARHDFEVCAPFGSYTDDPNSVFMTKLI